MALDSGLGRRIAACLCVGWALIGFSAFAKSQDASTIHPELWAAAPSGVLIRPEIETRIDQLLGQMTLDEKIGQMVQADIDAITPEDLKHYKLGSILAGGYAAPGHNVRSTPQAWLDLVDAYARAEVEPDGSGRKPVPILFGIDAVHGHAKIIGATIFPHNVALGAMRDPALMVKIGRATAEEVAATGIDWAFAPTLAVVRDPRWGRSYESYSEDPRLVASYATSMVTGLQGEIGTSDFMAPGHVLASAKHFLGDGGTENGRDQGLNVASEQVLANVHGAGYPAAIAAGTLSVMASYHSWQGTKMHAHHALLTDVLKGRFGFDGFAVGDWNAQEEIPGCTKFNCPETILAGIDMIMAPDSWKQIYENTLAEARSGEIPAARIDDAVRRILRAKALAGLLDEPLPKDRLAAGKFDRIGSAEHRAIAREAVRKSLVLLKNQHGLLPLKPQSKLLVTGPGADDIGVQAGGWTVDWQGDHNSNADFPGATSIYAGIKNAVTAAGGTATLSPDGSFTDRPDVAIVVFGEKPYAEFEGDLETLEFSPADRSALALLRKLHAQKIPVVAVFLSGRVIWVNRELNASDAFVAAWLPGSEGEGIADVLFTKPDGGVAYDFTGKLGFSWPRTAMPVRFDAADKPVDPLFPRGYGLSYHSHTELALLPEDPKPAADRGQPGTIFQAGHPTAPYSIYLVDDLAQIRMTTKLMPSPNGAATVALVNDGQAAIAWSGTGAATLKIAKKADDLSGFAKAGGAVSIRYRVDNAPASSVSFELICGETCKAALDATPIFKSAPVGRWQTIDIPLACFAEKGGDLTKVEAPFALKTDGLFGLTIASVTLHKEAVGAICPGV